MQTERVTEVCCCHHDLSAYTANGLYCSSCDLRSSKVKDKSVLQLRWELLSHQPEAGLIARALH
jgi:hypothetical protein